MAGQPSGPMGAPSAPPGMEGNVPKPPVAAGAGSVKWILPKGWSEAHPGGMRYATLTPAVQGKVDVSVVVLAGAAGGELSNANRWRGQIGLGPVDEPTLATMRKQVQSKAGAVSVYDFTSEGTVKSRMLAAVLSASDGNTWFFKMVGDDKVVAQSQKEFIKLLETLQLGQ